MTASALPTPTPEQLRRDLDRQDIAYAYLRPDEYDPERLRAVLQALPGPTDGELAAIEAVLA